MSVNYVEISDCARKSVGAIGFAGKFYWAYLLLPAYIIPLSFLVGKDAVEQGSTSAKVTFLIALVLPVAAMLVFVFRRRTLRRPNQIRIDAYGVTLRQVLHALAMLRRDLDRSTGWSNTRNVIVSAALRLGAIGAVVATLILLLKSIRGGPMDPEAGAGVLVGLALVAALWTGGGRFLRPRRRELSSSFRSWMLRLSGIALVLAAAAVYLGLFSLSTGSWGKDNLPGFAPLGSLFAGGVLCVLAFEKCTKLWRRATAEMHPRTRDARRFDARRPILFLRSFPDDAHSVGHEMTSGWDETEVVALEDALHEETGRYGPFIAIAEPGIALTSGAARDSFRGAEWRTAVLNWIEEALLVTMVAGWTEGVQWELDQVVARGHASKLLIVLPDGPHRDTRWQHVCRSFSGTRWHADLLGTDVRSALAVHFGPDGHVHVVASRAKSAGHYEAAVEVAIYGILCRARLSEQSSGSAVEPRQ